MESKRERRFLKFTQCNYQEATSSVLPSAQSAASVCSSAAASSLVSSSVAVSYTHLDVYKRQNLYNATIPVRSKIVVYSFPCS